MHEVLEFVFWGNSVKSWLIAAAFIVGGFIAGKICSWIIANIIKRICRKTKHRIDDIIAAFAERPLAILIFLGGVYIGLQYLHMIEPVELWAGRILSVFVVIVVAWTFSKILDAIIVEYVPTKGSGTLVRDEVEIQPVVRKLFNTLIWILAGVLVLRNLGYNVSALLAGLGLGGAAVALASKDTLANFFGSITVFVDKPFKLNDRIKISGYDGYITEMNIRTSRLKTPDNRTVIIPNSVFAANPIENISSEPNTKVTQTVNVAKDVTREQLSQAVSLLKDICLTCGGTDGTPTAGLVSVTGASYQLSFIFYVAKNADYLETVNNVNLEVIRRFEEAGIKLM